MGKKLKRNILKAFMALLITLPLCVNAQFYTISIPTSIKYNNLYVDDYFSLEIGGKYLSYELPLAMGISVWRIYGNDNFKQEAYVFNLDVILWYEKLGIDFKLFGPYSFFSIENSFALINTDLGPAHNPGYISENLSLKGFGYGLGVLHNWQILGSFYVNLGAKWYFAQHENIKLGPEMSFVLGLSYYMGR